MLTIYIPLSCLDYDQFPFSDAAEHGAAVRELANNLADPKDPLLSDLPGNSPRFVPSILLMALAMRTLQLDVLVTLKMFLVISFILFLVAAALFSKEYFSDKGQIFWSLAMLLFLWGRGWDGANAYMFSAILYTAYYPSVVSFSLSLLGLYFQLLFLRSNNKWYLVIETLMGAFAFVNHPLTSLFFFICSGLLYIEKRTPVKKLLLCFSLPVITSFALMSFWPYYDFFSNMLKVASGEMADTMDYQLTRQYLYSNLLPNAGPAVSSIPILILFGIRKHYFLLVGGFIVFGLIYLAGYLFDISLAERFIFFIMFVLQMAVSRISKDWSSLSLSTSIRNFRQIATCLFVLLLGIGILIQIVLVGSKFIRPAFKPTPDSSLPRYVSPNQMQLQLRNYLGEGDVVLSDIYTAWSIPVYTGARIIALWHTTPTIADNFERIQAIETFYNTGTPGEERMKIVRRYGITHVLLNFYIAGKGLEPELKKMGFEVVARGNNYCLLSGS
jgi:hypothetical protein